MPTYAEYLRHAMQRGFQPLAMCTFIALVKAGFNPITGTFQD